MRLSFNKWHFKRSVKLALIVVSLSGLIGFTGKRHYDRTCQKIKVEISNDDLNHFVDENDVIALLGDTATNQLTGTPVGEINTRSLEQQLRKVCPYIEDVQISNSLGGDLLVNIKQVTPIARLVRGYGRDYYFCDNNSVIPVSNKFTANVMVIDGSTSQLLRPDSAAEAMRCGAFELIRQIGKNELLSKLIVQATLDSRGEYVLYPQIANQQIYFGKPENIESKLGKLTAFYNKIIPVKGWDAYKKVTLKFDNQIVCE